MSSGSASQKLTSILLAGSSHTRLFYPYVKRALKGAASVSKLPYDAGRTDEMLISLPEWPVEGQDIIHIYAGHRDLMLCDDRNPYNGPAVFEANLRNIIASIAKRSRAKMALSNIPLVSEDFLTVDPGWNRRIARYNRIIGRIAKDNLIPAHDFRKFISSLKGGEGKYLDGLHFTREVYRAFAEELSAYLMALVKSSSPRAILSPRKS